jgi:hypothetical protein
MPPIDPRITPYALDRGIDDIVLADTPDSLPTHSSRLAPAQVGRQAELDRLMASPALNDVLRDMIAADVDPQLLTPGGYRDALQRTIARLRDAARRDSAGREVLNAAADILAAEVDLHELLAMYRRVLFQG